MKKKPVIKTAFIRDSEEREDYAFDFVTDEQLQVHLGKHPNHWIKEIYEPAPYKPYSAGQLFLYVFIGGLIGNFIGYGIATLITGWLK